MQRNYLNLSLLYLLPLIAIDDENWYKYTGESDSYKIKGSFLNAYSADKNKPWLDNNLFLVFEGSIPVNLNESNLKLNSNYHSKYTYRIRDKFYDIYVFSIPFEFSDEIKKIKNNNLILLNEKTKNKILKFWLKDKDSFMYQSLNSIAVGSSSIDDEIIDEKDIIVDPLMELL